DGEGGTQQILAEFLDEFVDGKSIDTADVVEQRQCMVLHHVVLGRDCLLHFVRPAADHLKLRDINKSEPGMLMGQNFTNRTHKFRIRGSKSLIETFQAYSIWALTSWTI